MNKTGHDISRHIVLLNTYVDLPGRAGAGGVTGAPLGVVGGAERKFVKMVTLQIKQP